MSDEAQAVERVSAAIGSTIHGMRLRKRMSQATLSRKSGVRKTMLSKLERGERATNFNLDALRAIALALGRPNLASLIRAAERNVR